MAKVIYSEIDNNPLFSGLAEVLPDISYSAAHPELKMTLIFPQAARRLDDGRNYPTIVFVQGSGWTSPNIYYEIPQLSRFAQLGYIVATLTHRSALDGHRAPAFLEDVKTAIRFLREKAERNQVPLKLWSRLQKGETIEQDGVVYRPEMVLGEPRKGLSLCYCTDTRPVPGIVQAAADVDLFICEGMYGEEEKKSRANEYKHMTFREAAELAKAAQAKELWLTHFSPSLIHPKEVLHEAKEIFPNSYVGKDRMIKVLNYEDECEDLGH